MLNNKNDWRERRAVLLLECGALTKKAEQHELSAADRTMFRAKLDEAQELKLRIEAAGGDCEPGWNQTRADQVHNRPGAGAVTTYDGGGVFRGLGDFLQSVVQSTVVGGTRDERLMQQRGALGMGETIASTGGFTVDQPLANMLLEKVFSGGEIASRLNRIPLTTPNTNGVRIPFIDETSRVNGSRLGGVQTYWAAEGATLTASKPKIGQIYMDLCKLTALCYASNELLADMGAMGTILTQAFTRELTYALEDGVIAGIGAGQPLGILNAGCTVSVAKEGSQTAATIDFRNVSKMLARLHPASWKNAVWLANVSTIPQLVKCVVPTQNLAASENVGGGLPLYDMSEQKLAGLPVVFVEQTKALGTVGDLILADLSQYLLIEKQMQSASSIHVQFLTDESAFRFTWRINGQPAWSSALTPANGSDTVSPFVTLATRA